MTTKMSAAPKLVALGIQDLSVPAKAVAPESLPTHLPKSFLFTKKGPVTPQLVGEGATTMYGVETFDPRSAYATHQLALAKVALAAGNAQMIERMVPDDAPQKANFALYLDIVADAAIPVYQRNSDGSYVRDGVTGLPLQQGTSVVAGYRCKWVLETINTGLALDPDDSLFGNLVQKPGTLGTVPAPSVMYPMFQFWASSFGAFGNNAGFRLWAPKTGDSSAVNSQLMDKVKAYPFRMAAIRRADASSTAKLVPMLSGDMTLDFVIPAGTINPDTDADVSLSKALETAWQQLNQPGYDDFFGDIGGWKVYQANIDTVASMIYAAEKAHLLAVTDFNVAATDEKWKVNFLSGTSTAGAPYNTTLFVYTGGGLSLTENTNLWAASGGDGTMGNAALATAVTTRMADYADQNSSLQDDARNVESVIYDSGFPLAAKKALCQFISLRKDTFVHLSTYTVGGPELDETDEAAIASTLRAQLQLYPESTYFGTPVVRGMITARYGDFLSFGFGYKLPLTLYVAEKSAKMMGASNGDWKKQYLFDRGELNVVDTFANINVNFVPADQRNKDWANGMNYPLSFDRKSVFFPAMKTAYSDDTSVLTSYFTAMACVEAQKVGARIWRQFSGSSSLTEAQLLDKVNRSAEKQLNGRFAEMFVIKPEATITSSDAVNGYGWTLPIKIYANNMKTVMTLSVQAYRMSALAA